MSSTSEFHSALTGSIMAGLDPMNGVVRSMAQQQVKASELQLDESRIKLMNVLRKIIKDAVADAEDADVIAAYQAMLDKYKE